MSTKSRRWPLEFASSVFPFLNMSNFYLVSYYDYYQIWFEGLHHSDNSSDCLWFVNVMVIANILYLSLSSLASKRSVRVFDKYIENFWFYFTKSLKYSWQKNISLFTKLYQVYLSHAWDPSFLQTINRSCFLFLKELTNYTATSSFRLYFPV